MLKELTTIVRTESVAHLVSELEKFDVTRFWVSHVHALGAGVDPGDYRVSFEDGGAYSEKARVEFIVDQEALEAALAVIRDHCATGRRGDGVVVVSDIDTVVNVRTGDRNRLALL